MPPAQPRACRPHPPARAAGYFFNGTNPGCLSTNAAPPATGLPGGDCYASRNLWTEAANPVKGNYSLAWTASTMRAKALKGERMLGVWNTNNLDTWVDRHYYTANLSPATWPVTYPAAVAAAFRQNGTDQPDLADATRTAIDVLARRGGANGFFLMVEGASIDKSEHPMDYERAIGESIDFDNAIGQAIAFSKTPAGANTLILVTADHAQGYDVWGTGESVAERVGECAACVGVPCFGDTPCL